MEVVFYFETLLYVIVANKTTTVLKIVLAILCRTTVSFRIQLLWEKGQFMCETRPPVLISIQQVKTKRNFHACCSSSWRSAECSQMNSSPTHCFIAQLPHRLPTFRVAVT